MSSKYYGRVGFAGELIESSPSVYETRDIFRYYKGDILRNNRRLQSKDSTNDDISISNQISIIADAYATSHIFSILSIEWQGVFWKVSTVDIQHPRLILTLGGGGR